LKTISALSFVFKSSSVLKGLLRALGKTGLPRTLRRRRGSDLYFDVVLNLIFEFGK
jgi:hypothetical protein